MVELFISAKSKKKKGDPGWGRADNLNKHICRIKCEQLSSYGQACKRYPNERVKRLIIRELVRRDKCEPNIYYWAFMGTCPKKGEKKKKNTHWAEITLSDFEKYILEHNLKVPASICNYQITRAKGRRLHPTI